MKSKMNRALSCLLTVLLLLTIFPVSTFAAGNDLKDELGITTENVDVIAISEESEAALVKAAFDRYWGLYADPDLGTAQNGSIVPGRIHSACHIASTPIQNHRM